MFFFDFLQNFFERYAALLTGLSFVMPIIGFLIQKAYEFISEKSIKTPSYPLIFMFLISLSILFFLMISEKELERSTIVIIASNTVMVINSMVAFFIMNERINAIHHAKVKHGVFEIDYLDR